MRHFGLRRAKALFLTLFSFGFCFVLLLNLMVHQLNTNNEARELQLGEYPSNHMRLRQLMGPESPKGENNYIHFGRIQWVDRKPKAANEKNTNDADYQRNGNHAGNKMIFYHGDSGKLKHNSIITNKLGSINSFNKRVVADTRLYLSERKSLDGSNTYEEDIDKVVIEDEDNDDNGNDADDIDPNEDYDEEAEEREKQHKQTLKLKDFGNVLSHVFTKPPLQFQEVPLPPNSKEVKGNIKNVDTGYRQDNNLNRNQQSSEKKVLPSHKKNSNNIFKEPIVINGIFWSKAVEDLLPKGMSKTRVVQWIKTMRAQPIHSLQPPSWDRCGRPKNGFVVLEDGTEMCARYRHPHDKLVLGEVLSFYLSVLLGMDSVPAVVLAKVNRTSPQWAEVDLNQDGMEWKDQQYVALMQWIHAMNNKRSKVQMPRLLLEVYTEGSVLDEEIITSRQLTAASLSDLVQWGSMIIFDYLTGNYDRVTSMQDAAESQKTPTIIQDDIRNLRKSTKTGKLWLIDNESGLLDAYDLLYRSGHNGERFVRFHQQMLQTMCIFQRPLVEALNNLYASNQPHQVLEKFARTHEPLLEEFPKDNTYSLFQTMFSKRLADVYQWIQFCQTRHKR